MTYDPAAMPELDPDLPFLAALEQSLLVDARQLYAEHQAAVRERERAHRWRERRAHPALRVSRRTATLTSLLAVIAASAWGASALVGSGPTPRVAPSDTRPVTIATGTAAHEQWSLQLWRFDGQLCTELLVDQQESSNCAAAPTGTQIRSQELESAARRYVFGIAAKDVSAVTITAGHAAVSGQTHPITAVGARHEPVAWFVSALPRPAGRGDGRAKVSAAPVG